MLRTLSLLLALATAPVAALEPPAPVQGVWWDPDRAGSGLSLTFLPGGGWFVVLYAHDAEGQPLFLTAQGTERGVRDDAIAPGMGIATYGDPPYGVISGPLLETRNGPCLGCSAGNPVALPSPYGELEIRFRSPRDAEVDVAGTRWRIEPFAPSPAQDFDRARFEIGALYAVTVANARDQATVLARGVAGRGPVIGFALPFALQCIDCGAGRDAETAERVRRMVEGLEGVCWQDETRHCPLQLHDSSATGGGLPQSGVEYRRFPTADGGLAGELVGSTDAFPWAARTFLARLLERPAD
jgi:hypothetical protein